jgi:hypothetical protein
MDRQLTTDWPEMLNAVAMQLNPIHQTIFDKHPVAYYWTTYQSEWAIDVVFREEADLERLYPQMVLHGMTALGSADVMRYLGKRICNDGRVPTTSTVMWSARSSVAKKGPHQARRERQLGQAIRQSRRRPSRRPEASSCAGRPRRSG